MYDGQTRTTMHGCVDRLIWENLGTDCKDCAPTGLWLLETFSTWSMRSVATEVSATAERTEDLLRPHPQQGEVRWQAVTSSLPKIQNLLSNLIQIINTPVLTEAALHLPDSPLQANRKHSAVLIFLLSRREEKSSTKGPKRPINS